MRFFNFWDGMRVSKLLGWDENFQLWDGMGQEIPNSEYIRNVPVKYNISRTFFYFGMGWDENPLWDGLGWDENFQLLGWDGIRLVKVWDGLGWVGMG